MNESGLDTMLRDAAPRAATPAHLSSYRERILAEAQMRRGRRVRSWTTGAVTAALLFGGGSAAMAASGMQTPWGWAADNVFSVPQPDGALCAQGIRVHIDKSNTDPTLARDAREALASLDLKSLDTSAAEAAIQRAEAKGEDMGPRAGTAAGIKQWAVTQVALSRVTEKLKAEGHHDLNGLAFLGMVKGCDK